MILVFFGLTGSGKSTLASACAARFQALHYNTDRVRKELAGLAATTRRPDGINTGIYTKELGARTYKALLERAEAAIRNSAALVILDGSYADAADRAAVRAKAVELGTEARFVFCWCSEAKTLRRLALRARDATAVSDGRPEIYRYQLEHFAQPTAQESDILRLNTEAEPEQLLEQLAAALPLG